MNGYNLTHLDDGTLLRQLSTLIAGKRAATAVLLAHIAEVDARRLYLPAAFPSMYSYCVRALRLAENAAYRHVRSARVARRFPRLYDDLATGRLHMTAISMLAPHLREGNVDELIAAACDRSRPQLDAWLAWRFPVEGPILPPAQIRAVGVLARTPPTATPHELPLSVAVPEQLANRLAPVRVDWPDWAPSSEAQAALTPQAQTPVPTNTRPSDAPAPPAHPYFLLKVALEQATHAKLERAQVLLAHSVRAGEVATVLDRALDALLAKLEQRKGASRPEPKPAPQPQPQPALAPDRTAEQPARAPRPNRTDGRGIPTALRREVWARDGGRCTFTSSSGRQCGADRGLEFDHVQPVARGGVSTATNLRIRCRAHNQLEAERAFGERFMQERRERGRERGRQEPAGARLAGAQPKKHP